MQIELITNQFEINIKKKDNYRLADLLQNILTKINNLTFSFSI